MKEDEFLLELDVFRTEVEGCMQFFYAYLGINDVLSENNKALSIINRTPLLWNTIVGALQTSFFIALTRIFDKNPKTHNVVRLLHIAQSNIVIFSAKALETRKKKGDANAHEWIDEYMQDIFVPTAQDFLRLRKYVDKYRAVSGTYSIIRHNVFGHKQRLSENYIQKLYSQTNIREIQMLLIFLLRLYRALWELFHNGRKPILIPMRYSVKSLRKAPRPERQIGPVQERIVKEAQNFIDFLSKLQ